VVTDFSERKVSEPKDLLDIGFNHDPNTDKWNIGDGAPDIIYLGSNKIPFDIPNGLNSLYEYNTWISVKEKERTYPLMNINKYLSSTEKHPQINFIQFDINSLNQEFLNRIKNDNTAVLVLTTENQHGMAEQRRVFFELALNEVKNPVILKRTYSGINLDQLRLFSATDLGSLLIDGYGDGVWAEVKNIKKDENHPEDKDVLVKNFINQKESKEKVINRILFGILQAARVRISKTEYIACPSCGRTLFDLQITTEKIRKRTEHLKGVKIAVMGCIVNGPGEMADADYGYVGSGVGKITLYRGKDIIKRNVPAENAVDELINLIKEDENWVEPR
jgi:(E)-4-hydroxy-3-methylbut-2-enyl-diphosphate synthase